MKTLNKLTILMNCVAGLCLIFCLLMGCDHCKSFIQNFWYPPESNWENKTWKYWGAVCITSCRKGPYGQKSLKQVDITVWDKDKKIYLEDEYEFNSAHIRTDIIWNKFEELTIKLTEEGYENAVDQYNKELAQSGPRLIVQLSYKLNPDRNKFIIVKSIKGDNYQDR